MITHPADITTGAELIEDLVSSCEAALILGRTPDAVRLMARRGRLVTAVVTRAGRLYRRHDVENLAKHLQRRTLGGSGRCRG
jgi:hypothetical protein